MSKSILIIDTPNNCLECMLSYDSASCQITGERFWKDGFNPDNQILHNCPLSHLPSKKDLSHYMQRGDTQSMTHMMMSLHDAGYNNCIDDILKGENDE